MNSTKIPFLSPGQADVLNELRPILTLATSPARSALTLTTRVNTLLAGPSGSGKSFLAKAMAREAGLPFWESNVSSWIVLGARNGNPTLVSLVEWIHNTPKGVIFLDELEKPFPYQSDSNSDTVSEWYNSVKMDLHSICDGRLPDGAIHVDESMLTDKYGGQLSIRECKSLIKFDVEQKLKTSFLIVGAGTWQHLWAKGGETIGFNRETGPVVAIDQQKLMKSISQELLLRFRHQILFLRPMSENDYHDVLRSQLLLIPEGQRERFGQLVRRSIPRALEFGLGMRMFEEVYTDLCVEVLHNCAGDEFVFKDVLANQSNRLI